MAYIGLKHLVVAAGAYTDGSAPTYTNSATVCKLIEANLSIDRADAKLYADDVLVESENGVTGGTITVSVDDLDLDEEVAVIGLVKDGTGTAATYTMTDADSPYCGCGFVTKKKVGGVNSWIGYWLYKVQFAIKSDEHQTRGASTDFATQSLEGNMMGVQLDNTGAQSYYVRKAFTTEADAIAWVDGNGQ